LIGAGCGLLAAMVLSQTIAGSSLLYGVRPYDLWTFTGVIALMMMVALSACYLPARRATHIDSMKALRTD
jgi:ABC-type antimicrobial peptide transport system permease subunit